MTTAPGGSRKAKYRQLPHTADLGLRIWGATREELFENAGAALAAVLTDRRRLRLQKTEKIMVEAPDLEALLVAWLNHLLYLYDVDAFLGREYQILALTPQRLSAQARGETYDPERHVARTAVKAATYHHLEIVNLNGGWQATVILDL
ncbi:MAG: archease [Deltaproteobacteria bacterium]|nr:archease [Deltaproteobacteria bacterium]MBI4794246.1 archease [Deltaproteobacteria bacterium]